MFQSGIDQLLLGFGQNQCLTDLLYLSEVKIRTLQPLICFSEVQDFGFDVGALGPEHSMTTRFQTGRVDLTTSSPAQLSLDLRNSACPANLVTRIDANLMGTVPVF